MLIVSNGRDFMKGEIPALNSSEFVKNMAE
jgi:hypothetical protein